MNAISIKKHPNSTFIIYLSLFFMLLLMFFVKNIHFEPIEIGSIRQIIYDEIPKGKLSYNPYWNYDYFVAFVAESFGFKDNFGALAKIFWFFETALAVFMLGKLCSVMFKNDKMVFVLAAMIFILSQSGQIDEKTIARPIYLLAVYYFLRNKWLISAVFAAFIFYLHIGLAIWWFLPSCIALAVLYLLHKSVSIKQILNYLLVVIVMASPVLCFYLGKARLSNLDQFSLKYFYYTCWSSSSVLMTLTNEPVRLICTLLIVTVLLVGYYKAKKAGCQNDNIIPITIGILALYPINFIFSDLLNNSTAIRLQLLRSTMYLELLAALFFAFLLAKQIKRSNYIFFVFFMIISFYYPLLRKFFGNSQNTVLAIFYAFLIFYELSGRKAFHVIKKNIHRISAKQFNIKFIKENTKRCNKMFKKPAVIAVACIFFTIPRLAAAKPFLRTILKIPESKGTTALADDEFLYIDIAKFTNEQITNKSTLLLIPFHKVDFVYYTDHKTFITSATPRVDILLRDRPSDFKEILERDLNYPPENFFENYSNRSFNEKWETLWKGVDERTIMRWKKKYGLTHVIREKDLPLDFPVIYENEEYRVYEIR